ncbi:MAG: hypothetical protein H0T91_02440 [Propionibacteriaceae bacterium]|nr:hypothetical protein [Propionibacteriaceae bacterium]
MVTFAAVQLRYGTGATGDETSVIPTATPVSPRAASARSIRYEVGQQHAGAINNVAGNQSISYTQIKQQRENFLREIAATRTKARWLVWSGFLCFVLGFALFASSVLGFLSEIFDAMGSGSTDVPDFDALGRQVAGVPVFALGWGTAAVGMLLLVVGVVLHVIATSRRKRVDREFVLPPPGQTHTS